MTADEFRKKLDRFRKAIDGLAAEVISPNRLRELGQVWRDLSRECALMKDAERLLVTSKHPGMVQPTRPLSKPPPVSASLRQRCPELMEEESPPSPSWPAEKIPEDSEASTVRMPTASEVVALEEIGKLQARVTQLEGQVKGLLDREHERLLKQIAAFEECHGPLRTATDGSVPE